ncbi:fibronectin type III domain-containing protein, partial [Hymenobacter terricola]|uniref:fibronectin type III domain-containing protein n=1 Tax=Hymenobacter terricola TaxID=2819236 RepID=UPI001CF37498
TSAALSWLAPAAGGSTFSVIYGLAGFVPPAGGTVVTGIGTNSTTLTGLTPDTAYGFYVQQVCAGANGNSTLAGPFPFRTLLTAPLNDEPCGATPLGSALLTGSNAGATTSVQAGITTPACSPAAFPKDVWFAFTPTGPSTTFTVTGGPAGMLRVFTSPDCSAGPFAQVFCASSGGNNTAISGPVAVNGLAAGQRYYVAVSGYGSSDATGAFTIAGTSLVATSGRA